MFALIRANHFLNTDRFFRFDNSISMKRLNFLGVLILFFMGQTYFYGQDKNPVADSINKQFTQLINSSNNFQTYKVIETGKIQGLRRDIEREIAALETGMNDLNQTISSQQAQLDEVEANLQETELSLEAANQEKDQLKVLGITTQKSTYHSLMIIVISILASSLLLFIYKYKNSLQVTSEAKELLHKNEEEYAEYKKQALLTQQKLGRQIVDQRKKIAHAKEI